MHACVWFAFSCTTLRCTCSPDGNAGNGYLLVVFPLAPHVVSLVAAASSVYEKFGHYMEELPVEQYQKFSHVVSLATMSRSSWSFEWLVWLL